MMFVEDENVAQAVTETAQSEDKSYRKSLDCSKSTILYYHMFSDEPAFTVIALMAIGKYIRNVRHKITH